MNIYFISKYNECWSCNFSRYCWSSCALDIIHFCPGVQLIRNSFPSGWGERNISYLNKAKWGNCFCFSSQIIWISSVKIFWNNFNSNVWCYNEGNNGSETDVWDSKEIVRTQELVRSLLAAAVTSQYPAQSEAATSLTSGPSLQSQMYPWSFSCGNILRILTLINEKCPNVLFYGLECWGNNRLSANFPEEC